MDVWERFFTERKVRNCNRLPRELVMTPSLSEFKTFLDNALRHDLVLVVGMEPEFGLHKLCDPFQLKVFYDLMTVGWKYIKH